MKKISFFALCVGVLPCLFLWACSKQEERSAEQNANDSTAKEELAYDTRRNPDASEAPYDSMKPKISKDSLAIIEFDSDFHDFGSIKDGAVVKHTYKFKNTGKRKLIVSQVLADCGCTTPSWSKEPIMPDQTGEITVQFDSKGKSGRQNKTITVEANTEEPRHYLKFRAEVTP